MDPKVELVQVLSPDFSMLKSIINELKGADRTMAMYGKECGITASTLSRIINGKVAKALTVEMLMRLYEYRDPNSKASFLDLAAANGMVTAEQRDRAMQRSVKSQERIRDTYRRMAGIINNNLFDRDVSIRRIPRLSDEEAANAMTLLFERRSHYPMYIQAEHADVSLRWAFNIVPIIFPEDVDDEFILELIRQIVANYAPEFLRDAWEIFENDHPDRTSIVVTHPKLYSGLREAFRTIRFRKQFSVVLLDMTEDKVVAEAELGISASGEFSSLFTLPLTVSEDDFTQMTVFDTQFGIEGDNDETDM